MTGCDATLLRSAELLGRADALTPPRLEELLSLVSEHLGADGCALLSRPRPAVAFEPRGSRGALEPTLALASKVADASAPLVLRGAALAELELPSLAAFVGHPLRASDGSLSGIFTVSRAAGAEPFSADDLAGAQMIAHLLAMALERETAAYAVRVRDGWLTLVLDQVAGISWTTDATDDMRFTSMSGPGLAAVGVDPAFGVGRTVGDITPHAEKAALPQHKRALAGERVRYEAQVAGRVLRAVLGPFRDPAGQLLGTIGVAYDVTQERETHERLRDIAEKMADAQRVGQLGSWEIRVDEQGKAVDPHFWSDQYFRLFGYEPGEIVPTRAALFERIHPDDLATVPRSMPEGSDTLIHEFRIVRKDGEVRHMLGHTRLFRDLLGRPSRVVGTTQDITERVRAKKALAALNAELSKLNAELERHVEERTAELSAANTELESFAYAVSHDLRAPLRAMSGFSRALLEDHGSTLAPEAKSYLEHIIAGSKRMADLIDGLLQLSRLSRGELRRDWIDVSAIAEDILRELARAEPTRRVASTVEPGLRVRGDARLVHAALQNLLANAWKYCGAREDASISVQAVERDGHRYICVKDNGAGFDMAHQKKLFRPFSRLHRETEFPGLGIGLATVERIVRRHGGQLFAEGAPGMGAEFGFSLPPGPADHSLEVS